MSRMKLSRRNLLKAGASALVGLPLLESLAPREVCAAGTPRLAPTFLLFKPNGIATYGYQATNPFPDLFYPEASGTTLMSSIANKRALGSPELAEYVDEISVAQGVHFGIGGDGAQAKSTGVWPNGPGNAHTFPGAWMWNGGELSYDDPGAPSEYAVHVDGPTLDYVMSKTLYGREPLVVAPWGSEDWLKARISAGENGVRIQPRVGAKNTYDALYGDLKDLVGQSSGAEKVKGSKSINDLLHERFASALASPRIGQSDRQKLELHRDSLSVLETLVATQSCTSAELAIGKDTITQPSLDIFEHSKVLIEVAVLAAACGLDPICHIQIGVPGDNALWTRPWNGQQFPGKAHPMSHHNLYSNAEAQNDLPNAHETNAEVDRIYLALYAHLIRCMKTYGVYESGVAVFYACMGFGRYHSMTDVPFLMAGSAGGFLKQGVFSKKERPHAELLNTIAAAAGMTKADGSPKDDYASDVMPTGLAEEFLA